MAIDEMSFKEVMSAFASGVTVVTTKSQEGMHGLTVSSFCSVSLHPPLVLVCVDKSASSHELILQTKIFAVNILAAHQKNLSARFATRDISQADRFKNLELSTAVTGAPILPGTLGYVDCKLHASYDGGDHSIFVGEVLQSGYNDGEKPLLYFRRSYQTVTDL